jgi:predicted kinase
MCGFSFSGKSTLASKIVEQLRCAYISLDDINAERGLWGGNGIPIEEWERTHGLARERLATWMATGKDAVVDDVNKPSVATRPLAGRGESQLLSDGSYLPGYPTNRTDRSP